MPQIYYLLRKEAGNSEESVRGQLVYDNDMLYYDGTKPDPANGVRVPPGTEPQDAISALVLSYAGQNPDQWRLIERHIEFGQFYPRVYRPFAWFSGRSLQIEPHGQIEYEHEQRDAASSPPVWLDTQFDANYLDALSQVRILLRKLESIFEFIEPTPNNYNTYGREIRDLLIIASTEAEAQWQGILNANEYTFRSRPSTNDYVKLVAPLKLADFELEFPLFPEISAINPFAGWNTDTPTQSLIWYDACNKVKHDRVTNFHLATMSNVIKSVLACVVMLLAQFGKRRTWNQYLSDHVRISKIPTWTIEEMYLGLPSSSRGVSHRNFQF